ncbi:MAG: hypothetical protein NTZ16_14605 [Verrucomicrobia bacterium]|nr:hypothetical protein [Verrucomicrobiota bacterium]
MITKHAITFFVALLLTPLQAAVTPNPPPAKVKVFDPTDGAITETVLPTSLKIEGFRSLLVLP